MLALSGQAGAEGSAQGGKVWAAHGGAPKRGIWDCAHC